MTQSKPAQAKPYPLRMQPDVSDWIRERAKQNERSVNVELNRVLRQMKEAEEQSQTT